jgi:WD40 repeat protein
LVYIWDQEKGDVLQRLSGHKGAVYSGVWHKRKSRMLSCSDDRTIISWWFDHNSPLYDFDEELIEIERGKIRENEKKIIKVNEYNVL